MGIFPKDRDLTQPPEEVDLRVDASFFRKRHDELHVRLDHFLGAHLTWRSRSSLQSLIRQGYVHIDPAAPAHPRGSGSTQVERRPGRKLKHGSRVVIVIPEEFRTQLHGESSEELEVLYEDREVLAVDKPPMLAVHPSGRHLADTLIQRVHQRYKDDVQEGSLTPRLCHRLDRETSGIVLIGKHPRTHSLVMAQFEKREVHKDYLAVVKGEPEEEAGTIDYALSPAHSSRIRLKMAASAEGLPSRTDWQVLERFVGYTLVRCRLHTGRQHQIRVHLAAIGHPLVGDKLYGPDESLFERAIDDQLSPGDLRLLELPRHALHNHRLIFRTPDGNREVEVVSPLPADLTDFLGRKDPRRKDHAVSGASWRG